MNSTFVIVKTVVLNPQGDVLILKRGMTAPRRPGAWDLPGGFVEPGEDVSATAKREIQEEAGLEVTELSLLHGISDVESDNNVAGTWLVFVGHCDKVDYKISWEHDEAKWVRQSELTDYITQGRQALAIEYIMQQGLLQTKHDSHPS